MSTNISVAIDGPSGAGKSTIARAAARRFGLVYVDTGAIYRTVAYAVWRSGASCKDPDAVRALLPELQIELTYDDAGVQRMLLGGEDVSAEIRTPENSVRASEVSAYPFVRDFLMETQRGMARRQSVVMDGRDIGTVVLPDATLKIFLTASAECRAERRFRELAEKGVETDYEQVLQDIRNRDYADEHRATAPLRRAPDAVLVDTSALDLQQSIDAVCREIARVMPAAAGGKQLHVAKSAGFCFGMAFLAFYIWLTDKTNGNVTYRIGGVSSIMILLGFFYLGVAHPSNTEIMLIILVIAMNFGKAGLVNAMQYTFAFIPDIDEVLTGRRREGIYSGVNNFLDVLFTTLEVVLIGFLLEATGFVKNSQTQPDATIDMLLIMYTIVPIVIISFGLFTTFKFHLTQHTHRVIREEVSRLREGGSMADVTPETRKVVEDLTGHPYEKCWGNNDFVTEMAAEPVAQK